MAHRLFIYSVGKCHEAHCAWFEQFTKLPGYRSVRFCAFSNAAPAVRSSQVSRVMTFNVGEKDTRVLYREEMIAWHHRHCRLHFSRLSPHSSAVGADDRSEEQARKGGLCSI
jgi:hypothetical protein